MARAVAAAAVTLCVNNKFVHQTRYDRGSVTGLFQMQFKSLKNCRPYFAVKRLTDVLLSPSGPVVLIRHTRPNSVWFTAVHLCGSPYECLLSLKHLYVQRLTIISMIPIRTLTTVPPLKRFRIPIKLCCRLHHRVLRVI